MTISHIFRADTTNVGDWYCPPARYFTFANSGMADILNFSADNLDRHVVVGGGGLLAQFFHSHMRRLADCRPRLASLVAWGVGESENINCAGRMVLPYQGKLPDYLTIFDLVGVRDYGAEYRWVPCVSCMLPHFDRTYSVTRRICIYDHKRVPIVIDGFDRLSNDGNDIDAAIAFLASAEVVITNSYHGAYWATLLGRRVLCIPNFSKMYRFKHLPILCRIEDWRRYIDLTASYPQALAECRAANHAFYRDVAALQGMSSSDPP